jgi:hypothetical protein
MVGVPGVNNADVAAAKERARRFVQRYVHSEERKRFEDGHDDALINLLMPEFAAAMAEAAREAAIWHDAYHTQYARAEALSLELRRLRDGQPDGHRKPAAPEALDRRVRYSRYFGQMDAAECEKIRQGPLYQIGDTILVWVNEGDIVMLGDEVPRPKGLVSSEPVVGD